MAGKICSGCKTYKLRDSFREDARTKDNLSKLCQTCLINKPKKARVFKPQPYVPPARRDKFNLVLEIKSKSKCIRCGESDPLCLQFDHRDRSLKVKSVSQMIGGKYTREDILAEIAKCDVLCANCHCRRTAKQFNWYGGL